MKKSFVSKTLAFPTQVWCVGSYDQKGQPNLMTIAWGGICCSSPPAVTISLRKATYPYGVEIESYHRIGDKIGSAFDMGKKL